MTIATFEQVARLRKGIYLLAVLLALSIGGNLAIGFMLMRVNDQLVDRIAAVAEKEEELRSAVSGGLVGLSKNDEKLRKDMDNLAWKTEWMRVR